MPEPASQPEKDPLLSHGAHEIRNPVAVITGYVRMLTSERMGPITDAQRKVLDEISVSAARLTALAAEMTLLGQHMVGAIRLDRTRIGLAQLIEGEVPNVPAIPDRQIVMQVMDDSDGGVIEGDAVRLRKAFNSLLFAHGRELVTSETLSIALDQASQDGRGALRVTIAGDDKIDELRQTPMSGLSPFVEFRGGLGYGLAIARQVIVAHGGEILSKLEPREDPKHNPLVQGAVLFLPVPEA